MAYKKFIKKNGKIYGPYIYHSKRVNGKVISEYHGMTDEKRLPTKSIFLGILAATLIIIAIILITSPKLTGNVIGKLIPNNNIEDLPNQFSLTLREGEFIPLDSIIQIQIENSTYNYTLNELYSGEPQTQNFYLENSQINNSGEGIGIPGTIQTNPSVYFQLEIYEETSTSNDSETNVTTSPEETNSTIELNQTSEPSNETSSPTITEENKTQEETLAPTENASSEEPTTEETITEEPTTEEPSASPLTGNVISTQTISGQIAKNQDYTYTLPEGKNVQLVKNSVKTQNKTLNDSEITIKKEGQKITISTQYTEETQGYGKEFLGEEKEIKFDLENLNFSINQSSTIKITYQNITIFEKTQTISPEEPPQETINETEELNETIPIEMPINQTNSTNETLSLQLTSEEKTALREQFKMIVLNSTAEEYKDKIIVTSKIGEYQIQNAYPASLEESKLKELITNDQIYWLKDLARELRNKKTLSTNREDLNSIYSTF